MRINICSTCISSYTYTCIYIYVNVCTYRQKPCIYNTPKFRHLQTVIKSLVTHNFHTAASLIKLAYHAGKNSQKSHAHTHSHTHTLTHTHSSVLNALNKMTSTFCEKLHRALSQKTSPTTPKSNEFS